MGLNFESYQELAGRTSNPVLGVSRLAVAVLGLAGEAGEVAEHVKKHIGHGHTLDFLHVEKELGDVLWYVAEICSTLGLDMGVVAWKNIEKLKRRYPEGFSEERSINREE